MSLVNEREEDFIDGEENSPLASQEDFKRMLQDVFKDYSALVLESPEELFKTLNERAFESLSPEVTKKLYKRLKANKSMSSQIAKILPTLEKKVKNLPKARLFVSPNKKLKMSGVTAANLLNDSSSNAGGQFASLKNEFSPYK